MEMSDFHDEGDNQRVLKLSPEHEHRIRCRAALKNVVAQDNHPQDLLRIIFSEEELQWLKQNLRT